MQERPRLITELRELEALARTLQQVPWLGVDVEANGMFAFRARLCTVQLSWPAEDRVEIAIVDSLEVPTAPLAEILGADGPTKILHDLTFDARMLQEHGITLGTVRDTSVAARFLGEPNSGLSSLLALHCHVELGKGLQNHDWARRPFTDRQLAYLADDVRYLRQLDLALAQRSAPLDIDLEIATECSYKLARALEPPRDYGPAYARIKGYSSLRGAQRSILKELVATRDRIAEQHDVPPHYVLPATSLLALARTVPATRESVAQQCRSRIAQRYPEQLLLAIRRGRDAGGIPDDEEPPTGRVPGPRERARLKQLSNVLSRWRKREAKARNVDLQVVMPGHCMDPLVSALATSRDEPRARLAQRLTAIEGICGGRLERYTDALHELAQQGERDAPPTADPQTDGAAG